MKNIFTKILLTFLCIICITANAQYADEIQFTSIESFLMNKILFNGVYKKNAEVLKERFVKKIILKDESGKVLEDILINREGRVSLYQPSTYGEGLSPSIEMKYDAKNNITEILKISGEDKMKYLNKLSYDDTRIVFYEERLQEGLNDKQIAFYQMRYDNDSDWSKLTGFNSPFGAEADDDSFPYLVNFKYDVEGRLYDVRVVLDSNAIYSINYSGDFVKIISKTGYETYFVKENIISKHIIYSEAFSFGAARTFSRDENGLIDTIYIEDFKGNKYTQRYEYDYYH